MAKTSLTSLATRLSVRVSPPLLSLLEELNAQTGERRSTLIRRALRIGLDAIASTLSVTETHTNGPTS